MKPSSGTYSCWMYKTHGKEYCSSHYITYDVLYTLVLADIQRLLSKYRKNTDSFHRFLDSRYNDESERKAEELKREYEIKQKRIEELNIIISRLYEDNVLGKIPDSRYETMSTAYENEQEGLRKVLPELRMRIEEAKANASASDKFINVIRRYTVVKELDAAILNELIDKIVVHHKEKGDDGQTYQQIEIFYRFIGKLGSRTRTPELAA